MFQILTYFQLPQLNETFRCILRVELYKFANQVKNSIILLCSLIYKQSRSLGNMSSLEKICAFDEISLFKLITAVQKLSIFFIANTRHY